jgi:hypothetical protein
MKLNLQTNFPDIARRFNELSKQTTFASAVALTRAAKDAQAAIRTEMEQVFDRPTKYTLNSMFLKGATKSNLEARVWLKDNPFGKGTPADRYLAPQVYGGGRQLKGMERLLQSSGLMQAGHFAVPAVGAQLDANGNVKRSQIVQILSQLGVQRGAGFESRRSNSTASRRSVARQGVTYFSLRQPSRGLQPGIYLKRKFAHGSAIRPVFIFVPIAQYQKRLKFFEIGEAAAQQRFPAYFDAELLKAISTARLR